MGTGYTCSRMLQQTLLQGFAECLSQGKHQLHRPTGLLDESNPLLPCSINSVSHETGGEVAHSTHKPALRNLDPWVGPIQLSKQLRHVLKLPQGIPKSNQLRTDLPCLLARSLFRAHAGPLPRCPARPPLRCHRVRRRQHRRPLLVV